MGPFPVDKAGLGGSGALKPDTVAAALRNGMSFYESLQAGACWVLDAGRRRVLRWPSDRRRARQPGALLPSRRSLPATPACGAAAAAAAASPIVLPLAPCVPNRRTTATGRATTAGPCS